MYTIIADHPSGGRAITKLVHSHCRNAKSKSCPFCRACLEEVKPGSLWMYTDDSDVVDMDTLTRENIRRLFMYINKLPLVVLHAVDLDIYQYRIK